MAKNTRLTVVVEGSGQFPIDMLRYDALHPDSESDSYAIQQGRGLRTVVLTQLWPADYRAQPTAGRWESFGWRVVGFTKERV